MAALLIAVTVLHLLSLAMLFTAMLDKVWWVSPAVRNTDLWYNCLYTNYTGTWLCANSADNDWLHAVQALMVVSVLFSAVSFLLFLCQLYSLRRGGLFYITGIFQIFAGLTVFSASLIYSLHAPEILSDSSLPPAGHFGYCFVVAWLCVPALLISGVLYIHLRKKE